MLICLLYEIIVDLIRCLAEGGTTVLIFFPGFGEIMSVWSRARDLERSGKFKLLPMHSTIPREEQEVAFLDPEPEVTHVVLATDVAESSITPRTLPLRAPPVGPI